MIAVLSLLLIVIFSIIITRVATQILIHTGMSREMAKFQARSAFSGVGFTTKEAENIVNHPVRRKLVMTLMLLGNAGIVTVLASLILGFVNIETTITIMNRIIILTGGLAILWTIARSKLVDRWLSNVIEKALKKYSSLEISDYAGLLNIAGGYKIVELAADPGDWIANSSLKELELNKEGVVVLGITRQDGTYIAAPTGNTKIVAGDSLLLYGHVRVLERLDERGKGAQGDIEHQAAVEEHNQLEREQSELDPERRNG